MEQSSKRKRRDEWREGGNLFSKLPDSLILQILSFLPSIDPVRTCVLLKRWVDLWKQVPSLNFYQEDFLSDSIFWQFVCDVLNRRDRKTLVSKLDFGNREIESDDSLRSVLKYAIEHKVQQINVVTNFYSESTNLIFNCMFLTDVKINGHAFLPSTLHLPNLISLHLERFVLFTVDSEHRADPFGNCGKLQTLFISGYSLFCDDDATLTICNESVAYLTFGKCYMKKNQKIKLVTPQLKAVTLKGRKALPDGDGVFDLWDTNSAMAPKLIFQP